MFRKFDKSTEYKEQVYDNETNSYIEMKGVIVGILNEKYRVLDKFEPVKQNEEKTTKTS